MVCLFEVKEPEVLKEPENMTTMKPEKETPEKMPEKKPEETTTVVPKETPEKMPKKKPEETTTVVPEEMPEKKLKKTATTTRHRGAEPRPQSRQGSGDETRGVPHDYYHYYYDATPWGRNEAYGPEAETHGARATTMTSMRSRILAWEWWSGGVRGVDRRRPGVRGRRDDLRV